MEKIEQILMKIDNLIWGIPLIALIMACGILLTIRTKGVQFRRFIPALRYMVTNESGGAGEVSSFGALCTALSATIGTGNIVGVASAISVGGPGALFWMIIAALIGMATKYTEGLLAVKYRVILKDGHVLGGPFYYIENGMGKKYRPLAKLFAFFGAAAGLLGIGTITQVNGITSAVQSFFDPDCSNVVLTLGTHPVTLAAMLSGLVVTVLAALVILGGVKRIVKVSEIVVPFMAILYLLCGFLMIFANLNQVPRAFAEILSSAFGGRAVAGGALGAMLTAMQKGIARGIFSNEAGLGSAPIAAAAAQTNHPARQGLVTMTGTFIDTILLCTMTGLSVVISGAWQPEYGLEGVEITLRAFRICLPFPPQISAMILTICLIFFAFTTILGWNYYAERCLEYLTGNPKTLGFYRYLYIFAVFAGPYITVSTVWNLADLLNGLMAFPNIIALIALSGVTAKITQESLYATAASGGSNLLRLRRKYRKKPPA